MKKSVGDTKNVDKDGLGFVDAAGFAQAEGYGVMAGVDAPVLGGTAMFGVGYAYAEDVVDSSNDREFSRWVSLPVIPML